MTILTEPAAGVAFHHSVNGQNWLLVYYLFYYLQAKHQIKNLKKKTS